MAERVGDTEQPRDRVVERVRDKVTERVRDTEQLRQSGRESERHRAAERKHERDRKKEGCAGSVRGRRRISKITILPLKMLKLTPKKTLSRFGPVSVYRLVPPDFAGTRPIQPVFSPVRNKGVFCTGTVYSGRTSRYDTEFTSLTKVTEVINLSQSITQ